MAGFKHMQKKKGMVRFNRYCAQLAEEYAQSGCIFTGKFYAEREGISEKCFWAMLDHAVIYNLIEDQVVNLMESKAQENQSGHGSDRTSTRHYEKIREERRLFVYKVAKEFAMNVADDFAKTIPYFLEKYGMEVGAFKDLLQKSMDKAQWYGISSEMVSSIQYGIFFYLLPYLNSI